MRICAVAFARRLRSRRANAHRTNAAECLDDIGAVASAQQPRPRSVLAAAGTAFVMISPLAPALFLISA
jgi:hypothetical protein